MSYSKELELKLLQQLSESIDPMGVPFSWEGSHHPQENVATKEIEFHFNQLESQGYVEKKFATKDGANFLITPSGRACLENAEFHKPPVEKSLWRFGRALWLLLIPVLGFLWFLFDQVLDPVQTCHRLPVVVADWLAKCPPTKP